jgi:hypothetical protein
MQGKQEDKSEVEGIIELNKEVLTKYQAGCDELRVLKDSLNSKMKDFEMENKGLIENIKELSGGLGKEKEIITGLVIVEYDKDETQRKFLGGMSVKVEIDLIYKEEDALKWAVEKMPVAVKTVLDKKMFELFAKDKNNSLDFVDKCKKIKVGFPGKGISFEEGDE